MSEGACGHAFPKVNASLTVGEALVIATGALKRREPTGGWAKGMPSQRSVPLPVLWPLKVPEVVRTTKDGLDASVTAKAV